MNKCLWYTETRINMLKTIAGQRSKCKGHNYDSIFDEMPDWESVKVEQM